MRMMMQVREYETTEGKIYSINMCWYVSKSTNIETTA